MKKTLYLAICIIDGKAEVNQIAEKFYNDYGWRLKMQQKAEAGEYQIYFTETEIFIEEEEKHGNT